jgi:hypothetical protein
MATKINRFKRMYLDWGALGRTSRWATGMDQVTDRFRSSTWGWLRGTLAGWGTLLLYLVGIGLVIISSNGSPISPPPMK